MSQLVADVRVLAASLLRSARSTEEVYRAVQRKAGVAPRQSDVIAVDMYRAAADLLRRALHAQDDQELSFYLKSYIRDFRRTAEIRRSQVEIGRGQPYRLLRDAADNNALKREIHFYDGLADQLTSIVNPHEVSSPEQLRRTA